MKILIQNYSSPYSTEPLYFMECLKRIGVDAILWADSNIPTFDMFDTARPDVFVGHFAYLTEDIVKYLSQNKSIKFVLNVSSTNIDQLKTIKETMLSMGIENVIFFSNDFSHNHGEEVLKILPAYDIFIQAPPQQFNIPLAVITNNKEEKVEKFLEDKEVYHLASYGKKEQWGDYTTDIRSFWGVCKCYDEVTVIDDGMISLSQFFFQATMLCNKFNIISQREEQREAFQDVLSQIFTSEETSDEVDDVVKRQIIKNHTCFNRSAQLMNLIGDKETAEKLERFIKDE